jgi:hypothetical protein
MDFQQQDSQEFLRFLLDGMSEDLCRRKIEQKSNNNNNNNALVVSKSRSNSILPVLPQLQNGRSPERNGSHQNAQSNQYQNDHVSLTVAQGREKLSSILKLRQETRAMRDNEEENSDPAISFRQDSAHETANSSNNPSEVQQSKLRIVKDIQRARKTNNNNNAAITASNSNSMSNLNADQNEEEERRSESRPNSGKNRSTFQQVREVFVGRRSSRRKSNNQNENGENSENPADNSAHERRGSEGSVGPPNLDTQSEKEIEDQTISLYKSAFQSWNCYLKLNDSVITDIFGGLLQSTVQCTHCQTK